MPTSSRTWRGPGSGSWPPDLRVGGCSPTVALCRKPCRHVKSLQAQAFTGLMATACKRLLSCGYGHVDRVGVVTAAKPTTPGRKSAD